ncbi:MAG: GNAT family N-acetyltransferase [Nanoarchaeota archaeon]|nr:GNAT family N-acetyltransferase [Nanoarchaeota archaeon]
MKISKAVPEDYEELHILEQEWVKEGISPLMTGYNKKDFVKEMKNSTVFLAKKNNKIIGYLTCKIRTAKEDNSVHSIKKGTKYADIDSLYVKKNYRNKKVGTALLKHCLKELEKAGYERTILSADSKEMDKLIKFYEKHGFKVLFTRMMLVNKK